jgi:magnesium chelatase family protein
MKSSNKQPQKLSFLTLLQELEHRTGTETIPANQQRSLMQLIMSILQTYARPQVCPLPGPDIRDIRGQAHVKRALEIAAAGGHSILLVGPPGAGKVLLARTVPSLLPAAEMPYPLRELSPSISKNAFLGDETTPGEVALAYGGVLLLPNLDTFDLSVLTLLAHAVETQVISTSLQKRWAVLPASFILVATLKPCPCGFAGDHTKACLCSPEEFAKYRLRLKKVVHTCFDIEIEVPLIREESLDTGPAESSAQIRQHVEAVRAMQQRRYAETPHLRVNADLRSAEEVQRFCSLDAPGAELLTTALRQLHLSPWQMLRVQGVARTIADLSGSPGIQAIHLAEAIQYLSRFIR